MYGQKTNASIAATSVGVASWWMWGVTIMLAIIAGILLVRVAINLASKKSIRP